MEPTRDLRYTLVDLLDRVLDKGLVIYADLIVSLAGIPLIGVNLRAALAGMETMLMYGVMKGWDESTQAWEREHRVAKEPSFIPGEETILRLFGSHHYQEGIYMAWRYGYLYLTSRRLFIYSQDLSELLFETPLTEIKALGVKTEKHFTMRGQKKGWDGSVKENRERERKVLYVLLESGKWAHLHVKDVPQLKVAIENVMRSIGLSPEEEITPPPILRGESPLRRQLAQIAK